MSPQFPPTPAGAHIWPPAPTSALDDGRSRLLSLLSQYRSPAPLTRCMLGLLAITVAADVAESVGFMLGPVGSVLSSAASVVSSLTGATTGILFLVWLHRLYKNLTAFGVAGLRHSPAIAVVMVILPFINLYKPVVIVREIWRASAPQETRNAFHDRWADTPSTPLIWLWWVMYLAYNSISVLTSMNSNRTQFEITPYVVSAVLSVISGSLLFVLAGQLTAREERRYLELSASLAN